MWSSSRTRISSAYCTEETRWAIYPLEELRGRVGMVLQTNILFTGTIRENLLWGRADAFFMFLGLT